MTTRVWVENWEHGCCGDAFRVGEPVVWPVTPQSADADGMVRSLGDTPRVTWAVERHNPDATHVTGTVTAIAATFCGMEEVTEGPDAPYLRAAADTAVFQPRTSIEAGQHEEDHDGLSHAGYVVDLADVIEVDGE